MLAVLEFLFAILPSVPLQFHVFYLGLSKNKVILNYSTKMCFFTLFLFVFDF